ncbi:MAG TPA: hypothetical protein DC024_04390 [Clostridiales bacterium]|nr:hypothetical protein [Clostridiales bacterium]
MDNKLKQSMLFHYCTIETFCNIIKNKTIRLSDVNKTNDFMEKKWCLKHIDECIEELFFENPVKASYDNYLDLEAIKSVVQKLTQKFFIYIAYMDFVFCLSEEGDMLSQWRGYAQDGTGVSIAFSTEALAKIVYDNRKYLTLEKVVYSEPRQKVFIKQCIERYYSRLYKKYIKNRQTIQLSRTDGTLNSMIKNIYSHSLKYKNPAFFEENEWRLIFNSHTPINKLLESMSPIERYSGTLQSIDFCAKNNMIVPFYDLSFNSESDLIQEIIIGPKSRVSKQDIQLILSKYNFDYKRIEIALSSLSYR